MGIDRAFILLHLVGFAAFLGGAFAQTQFLKMSQKSGLATAVRDEYERLAAAISTKVELPVLFAQVVTGTVLMVHEGYAKQHWLHAKMSVVLALLVLAHLEMFNARKIVKARAARGDAAEGEIAAMKKKHGVMGAIGTLLVVAVVVLAMWRESIVP